VDLNLSLLFAAYFFGSIPFGLLIVRWKAGLDIRTVGSGNIGASNVSRACGKLWGRVTMLLDAAKGGLPCGLALYWGDLELAGAAGLAAIVGHCWPVWLGFKGGKGVATTAGVLAVVSPMASLAGAVSWLLVYSMSKKSSLASLTACVALLVAVAAMRPEQLSLALAIVAIILIRHRENIQRLLAGEERTSSL
jgi:glycerol-3-phosphate acyltransferase PlsY